MRNKIMNLALKQIKSDDKNKIFAKEPFFIEHFKVFRKNSPFDEDTAKAIQQDLDINRVNGLCDRVINIFENKSTALFQK